MVALLLEGWRHAAGALPQRRQEFKTKEVPLGVLLGVLGPLRLYSTPRRTALPSKVHLDDLLVRLHLAEQPFGQHAALVQHRDLLAVAPVLRQRADELHVVLDD